MRIKKNRHSDALEAILIWRMLKTSNHGGRLLNQTPGVADVLSEIAEE